LTEKPSNRTIMFWDPRKSEFQPSEGIPEISRMD
jgi:hypothetical protein